MENKIIIRKRFLGKATGHNDHYMINMSRVIKGQKLAVIDS